MSRFIFAAAALLTAATSLASDPALKIFRDDEATDTVRRSKFYLVAVTDPDATASVNGAETHVYKTGSFGAEVNLKPGLNTITVSAARGNDKTSASLDIFYDNSPAKPASETPVTNLQKPLEIVSLPGAYLQFGNGGDRLGGSKMNYIDPDIAMTAVAETPALYKVALSDNRYAWLPKEYATAGGDGAETVNTGSWSIANTGKTDRITISLPKRLPYYSRTLIDPSTIKISLYGATNNSNWITQRSETEMIDFVDFEQEESDVLTLVIRFKDKYQWGYSVAYGGNSLVVDVRHRPSSLKLKDLVIGLDAGHGGKYPGAISPSGLTEKEVNLDIILNVADMLRRKGAKVVLTRDGDTGPSMSERKKTWHDAGVDIALSVHNNSSGNPLTTMGTSAYYKHISNRAFASALHRSMLSLGLKNFGLTGNFNFSLNGPTEYPNALVEVLFMSSLPEEELLADPAYRKKLAAKIVEGLENYLDEVKRSL